MFWAVELPAELRQRLGEAQARLAAAAPGEEVRWVAAHKLHLTVKFLGEVEDPGPVVDAVAALPAPGPFALRVAGLGCFGGRRPRVLWAGVDGDGLDGLRGWAEQVDAAMASLGFAPETRRYTPHLTLGRVRRPRKKSKLPAALESVSLEPFPFAATELVLFATVGGDYVVKARRSLQA